jgi:tetratricopeptide (TPR) repeat protein
MRDRRTACRVLCALALAAAALLAAACGERRAAECCPCSADAGRPLDEKLMALLSSARAYHHEADLYLAQRRPQEAVAALRALLALPLAAQWPEAEEARLDAAARLAKLLLEQGDEAAALALVDEQLAGRPRPSFYGANLHAVRGEVLEARVKRLDAQGDKAGAREVAREAIAAFERAIAINKQLQQGRKREEPKR